MYYRKMIASLEAVVENETIIKAKPNDNIEINDFANVVSDENPITQDLDDLEMVNSALEAYRVLLKSSAIDGVLDQKTMLAVNHSLECFGLSPITNRFISLEDYGTISQLQQRVASEDFIKGIGDKISAGAKKLYEALRKFLEWIQNFYRTWIKNSTSKIKVIKNILDKSKNSKGFYTDEQILPKILYADNEFILNDINKFNSVFNVFMDAVQITLVDGPTTARIYQEDVRNGVNDYDTLKNINIELCESISELASKEMQKGHGELDIDSEYFISEPCAGNSYFYMEIKNYLDAPYIVFGFSNSTVPEENKHAVFSPDYKKINHMLTKLIEGYEDIGKLQVFANNIERYTVKSMLPIGDDITKLYIKTIRGLFGSVTDIVGYYDRFSLAVCKVIEKSLVI